VTFLDPAVLGITGYQNAASDCYLDFDFLRFHFTYRMVN